MERLTRNAVKARFALRRLPHVRLCTLRQIVLAQSQALTTFGVSLCKLTIYERKGCYKMNNKERTFVRDLARTMLTFCNDLEEFMKKWLVFLLMPLVGCKHTAPVTPPEPTVQQQEIAELSDKLSSLELMNTGVSAQEAGNWFYAYQCYQKVIDRYPLTEMAAQAHYLIGKMLVLRKQFTDAFSEFDIVIKDYPSFEKYNQVIADQFDVAVRLMQGERPYYWGLIPGFRDYGKALEFFDRVVDNAPYGEYAPKALFYKAKLALDRSRPEDAIVALERLINDYKTSTMLPEAYMLLGKTYASISKGPQYDQRSTQKAIHTYEDFVRNFPKDEKVPEAEQQMADLKDYMAQGKVFIGDFYYFHQNNLQAARTFYNAAISVAPESKSAKRAKEVLERINKGVECPRVWVDYLTGRPKHLSNKEFIEYAKLEHLADEKFQVESRGMQIVPGPAIGAPIMAPFDLTSDDPTFIEPVEEAK